MKKIILLASVMAIVALSCSKEEKADLILLNAEVYTMEEDLPWASAIVISENEIVAVLEEDRSLLYQKMRSLLFWKRTAQPGDMPVPKHALLISRASSFYPDL